MEQRFTGGKFNKMWKKRRDCLWIKSENLIVESIKPKWNREIGAGGLRGVDVDKGWLGGLCSSKREKLKKLSEKDGKYEIRLTHLRVES